MIAIQKSRIFEGWYYVYKPPFIWFKWELMTAEEVGQFLGGN